MNTVWLWTAATLLSVLCLILWSVYRSHNEHFATTDLAVTWTKISKPEVTGDISDVAIGNDGAIFALNSTDQIYTYVNNDWIQLAGALTQIDAKSRDDIVGVDRTQVAFRSTSASGNSQAIQWTRFTNSRLHMISIGGDGTIWATVLPLDGTWGEYRLQADSNWLKMPGSMSQVAVVNATEIYGLSPDGSVWKFTANTWSKVDSVPMTSISVGSDSTIFGIDKAKGLWYRNTAGSDWKSISGMFTTVSGQNSSQFVVIDGTGTVMVGKVTVANTAPKVPEVNPTTAQFISNQKPKWTFIRSSASK